MAYDWDSLFKYDTTFNPRYEQPAADPFTSQNRFAQLAMPEYNMEPMRRYSEYLGSEPTRDQFKPNRWQNLLYGVTGGIEAMSSGNIARGLQLTQALRDRPFEEAYQTWNQRGNKVKADVELANTEYRNRSQAYDRERQRNIDEQDSETRRQNAIASMIRAKRPDVKYIESGDGNVYEMTQQADGTVSQRNTGLKIKDLTPEQKIGLEMVQEEGRNTRNERTNATSRANNANSVAASIYGSNINRENNIFTNETRKYEGRKSREFERELQNTPLRPRVAGEVKPPTPTELRNPIGLLEKGYPEFNVPELVRSVGGQLQIESDPAVLEQKLRRLADGDESRYQALKKRWLEFDQQWDVVNTPLNRRR